MANFAFHSNDLRQRLEKYARILGVSLDDITQSYERLIAQEIISEKPNAKIGAVKTYIAYIDVRHTIPGELDRNFYGVLRGEQPFTMPPHYGLNMPTLIDRMRRVWEQIYNIIICKLPSHWIRILWLRAGGMKIGKGSTVWRNTEVIGIENIRIGDDFVVGWHCQLDGRSGLFIGNHVTIASYVLIIAGGHDEQSELFGIICEPIYIEDYVWIASRVMIVDGAHLGHGCIVGGGTVVNKPIAPYKIVTGFNAKVIGERPHNLHYRVKGRGLFNLLH